MNWPDWLPFRAPSPEAAAHRDVTPRSLGRKTPVESLRFLVLDAEATGFNLERDRILSLATVPIAAGRIDLGAMQSWLVYQPTAPLNSAVQVHGILPSETAQGAPEADVLREVLPHLNGTVLVGHHISFDVSLLNHGFKRHFRFTLRNHVLDTAVLAMRVLEAFGATAYPGQRPPSLEEVCEHCGIRPMERHTATGDTFTTAELFLLLLARLQRRRNRPLVVGDLPIVSA